MSDERLLGMDVPYAPNRFQVTLAESDLRHFGEVVDEVADQIGRHLEHHADEQGWAYGGRITVRIGSGEPGAGRIEVESTFDEEAPGARLMVLAGEPGGGSFEVSERAVIGREPGCEVALTEPAVSRQHAEIEWTYRGYVLRDLGSRNGTFVNSAEIDEVLLADGDMIEVGLVQMRFRGPGR